MLQGSFRFADIRRQKPGSHTTDVHRAGYWKACAIVAVRRDLPELVLSAPKRHSLEVSVMPTMPLTRERHLLKALDQNTGVKPPDSPLGSWR